MSSKPYSRVLSTVFVAAAIMAMVGCATVSPSNPGTTPPTVESPATPTATPSATAASVPTQFPANTPLPEATASSVEPVIVVAGLDIGGASVSASGYVAGVVETDGTCTFSFSNGTAAVTLTSSGISNVTTTSCGLVQAPVARFSSGSWGVTLTYKTLAGETVVSQSSAVEIP
jgi:hypothetical protein